MALRRREAVNLLEETMSKMSCMAGWTDFLYCSRGTYRYDFPERVLIYAQCPDASAVAPLSFWKEKGLRIKQGADVISVIGSTGNFRLLCDVRDTYRPYHAWQTPSRQWQLWDRERALAALNRAYRMHEDCLTDACDMIADMTAEQLRGNPVYRHRDMAVLSCGYSVFCRAGVRSASEDYLTRLRAEAFPPQLTSEELWSIGELVTECTARVLNPIAAEMRRHADEGRWWVVESSPYVLHGIRPLAVRQEVERGTAKMWGENAVPPCPGMHYRGTARVLDGNTAYIESEPDELGRTQVISISAPEGSAIRQAIEESPHVEFDVGRSGEEIFMTGDRDRGLA